MNYVLKRKDEIITVIDFADDELKLLNLVSDRNLLDVTKLPSRSLIEGIYDWIRRLMKEGFVL